LRLAEGIDVDAIGRWYAVDVWARFAAGLRPFLDDGLVNQEGSRLRLSRDGMLVANEIMAVFV